MIDPFGFNVVNEPSPYDTALAYSANPTTRSRASFLGPSSAPGVLGGPGSFGTSSPYPSSSSMHSVASSSHLPAASSRATSPMPSTPGSLAELNGVNDPRPWVKQRSASAGDSISSSSRQQFRGNLIRPGIGNRSKLSGEIGVDVSIVSRVVNCVPFADLVFRVRQANSPTDSPQSDMQLPPQGDLTKSKLYQRTLKAQKALEKDRAKAAAQGRVSKFDMPDESKSGRSSSTSRPGSRLERRQSGASSFMSDVPAHGRRSRSSLGWFRSSSEATLPLPPSPSYTLPLHTSRSSSQLPLPGAHTRMSLAPPSPELPAEYAQKQSPQQPLPTMQRPSDERLKPSGDSSDRLKAYRESIGAAPPPRDASPRGQRSRESTLAATAPNQTANQMTPVLSNGVGPGVWSNSQRSTSGPVRSSSPLPGHMDAVVPPTSAPPSKTAFDGANLPNHFQPPPAAVVEGSSRPLSGSALAPAPASTPASTRPTSTSSERPRSGTVTPSTQPVPQIASATTPPTSPFRARVAEGQRTPGGSDTLPKSQSQELEGAATRQQPAQPRPPRIDSIYSTPDTLPPSPEKPSLGQEISDIRQVEPNGQDLEEASEPTRPITSSASMPTNLANASRYTSMNAADLGVLSDAGPSVPLSRSDRPSEQRPQANQPSKGQEGLYPERTGNGPLPAGAGPAEPRKRKSSFNLLLGSLMGGSNNGSEKQEQDQSQRRTASAGHQQSRSAAPARSSAPHPQQQQQQQQQQPRNATTSSSGKVAKPAKGGFFSRHSKPPSPGVGHREQFDSARTPSAMSSRTVPSSAPAPPSAQSRPVPSSPTKPLSTSQMPTAQAQMSSPPLPPLPAMVYRRSNTPQSPPRQQEKVAMPVSPQRYPQPPMQTQSQVHLAASSSQQQQQQQRLYQAPMPLPRPRRKMAHAPSPMSHPQQQGPLRTVRSDADARTDLAMRNASSSTLGSTSGSSAARLSKAKPNSGGGSGGGFSLFGRSRSKSLSSKTASGAGAGAGRNGHVDQWGNSSNAPRSPMPPQQLAPSPVLSKGRPQNATQSGKGKESRAKKASRWLSGLNDTDGYHPAPPPSANALQ